MSGVLDDLRAEERAVGFTRGHIAGRREGRKEGEVIGIDNTLKAISLIQAGKYAIEEIASLSGLPVDKVKDLLASLDT